MSNGTQTSEKGSSKTRDAVTTAAALVALIGSAYKLVLEVQGKPNGYVLLGFGLLAFGAAYVLAWLARRWLAPPSSFRKPSALDIGRKYLRGRDTDLDNLLNRLKDFPLVWLVGESGAGKSLLLERGLVPRLQEERSFFPVYLEHWGADRGPARPGVADLEGRRHFASEDRS